MLRKRRQRKTMMKRKQQAKDPASAASSVVVPQHGDTPTPPSPGCKAVLVVSVDMVAQQMGFVKSSVS